MQYINVGEISICNKNLSILPDLSRFTYLQKLDCSDNQITQLDNLPSSLRFLGCYDNKMENNNLKYWKEQTKNKKLELLKKKFCIRKIQRQWRKYWYDFYRYEIINGQNIGFCRFIEKSYFYHNK